MSPQSSHPKKALFLEIFGEDSFDLLHDLLPKSEWLSIQRGEVVFRSFEPSNRLFFILSGVIRLHNPGRNSTQEVIVQFLRPGDMLGLTGVIKNSPHRFTAFVHSDWADLFSVDAQHLRSIIGSHPKLSMRIVKQLDRDATAIETRAAAISAQKVSVRIETMLKVLLKKFGLDEAGYINLELSPIFISKMIGATRTTVYRSLKKMEESGILDINNHKMRLLEPSYSE